MPQPLDEDYINDMNAEEALETFADIELLPDGSVY